MGCVYSLVHKYQFSSRRGKTVELRLEQESDGAQVHSVCVENETECELSCVCVCMSMSGYVRNGVYTILVASYKLKNVDIDA